MESYTLEHGCGYWKQWPVTGELSPNAHYLDYEQRLEQPVGNAPHLRAQVNKQGGVNGAELILLRTLDILTCRRPFPLLPSGHEFESPPHRIRLLKF